MKKGLLALTMLIVFAASVYAYAPVLSNIPDVIIGDVEDGDANNFFRFSDAFMFDTNVSDQDDADADLKWSWVKVSGTGDITINGLGEEATSTINPTNELRAAGLGATFRDIQASPVLDDPGPYSGTLSDVYIAVHVSDGVAEDSQELRVTSVDGAEDGNSGLHPDLTDDFSENTPSLGGGDYWEQFTGITPVSSTTYGEYDAVNGRFVLKFPASFTGWYQWLHWNDTKSDTAVDVPYTADKLVAVKLSVSASKADQNPSFRLRVADQNYAWTAKCSIGSNSAGGGSGPTQTAQDFVYVYKPQYSTGGAYIAFDHWTASGGDEVYIESLKVYTFAEPALTAEASVTNLSSFVTGGLGDSSKVTIGDDITIASTNTWATAASYVQLTNDVPVGKLLKATYSVSSSGSGTICGVRTRLDCSGAGNDSYAAMFRVDESLSNDIFTSTPTDIESYIVVYDAFTSTESGLALWCDSISNGGTGTTVYESITVESGDLPVLLND